MSSFALPVVALAAASLAAGLPAQTFTRIIGAGDPVPGGTATIQGFTQAPAMGGGVVAYVALHPGASGLVESLYKGAGSAWQRVVTTGDAVPAWGRSLQSLTRLAVDSDGSVAFLGTSTETFATFGILADAGGTLRSLLDTGMTFVGLGTVTTLANISLRADGGFVVCSGGGRLGSSSISAVFSANTASRVVRVVALEGQPAPGGGTFTDVGGCDVRDGQVVFDGSVQTSIGVSGIYVVAADGNSTIVKVVDTTDTNPVTGLPFGNVGFGTLDEDDVAYFGFESRFGQQGIHSTYASPIPAGVSLPGAGPAGSLEDFHLDQERIVFEARDSMRQPQGLFVASCGGIDKVLAPGDMLDGKQVQDITHGDEAMDGDRLALLVGFTDSTQAIYVVDLTTFDHYGVGVAGELGLVPRIDGFGCPRIGTTMRIELRDGPSGRVGALAIGTAPASIPLVGGTVLVQPLAVVSVLLQPPVAGLPRPWLSLPFPVPNDPGLRGLSFFLQAHYADAAAIQGVSLSDGFRLTLQ